MAMDANGFDPEEEKQAPGRTVAVPFSAGVVTENMRGPELMTAMTGQPPPPPPPEPEQVPLGTVPPMLERPAPPPPPEMLARPDEDPQAAPLGGPPSPGGAASAPGGAPRTPGTPAAPLISPEEKAAYAARTAAGQKQVDALAAEKTAVTDRATAVSKVDSEESKLMEEAHSNAAKIQSAEQAKFDQAREDIKNFKERDLFDGHEAARVGAWLMAGIGEFAAKRSGTTNTALQVLNQATERYTQKERARYDRLVKKGEMSERDMQTAETKIINERIGIREMFISKREAAKSKFDGPEAAAKFDGVEAGLKKLNAKDEADLADLARRRQAEETELQLKKLTARANATAAYANAGQSKAATELAHANARKVNAEAGVIEGGGGMPGGGRAAGKMIDLALLREQLKDDVGVIKSLYGDPAARIGPKALSTVQDNMTRLEGSAHPHGAVDAVATVGMRGLGLLPRTAYEGLNQKQKRLMGALDLIATKAAGQLGSTEGEREHAHNLLMPSANDPPEVVDQKINNLLSMSGAIGALSGQYSNIAARGAAAERQQVPLRTMAPEGSEAPSAATTRQVAEANDWLRKNPNDPRAPGVRQRLREMTGAR